MTIVKCDFCKNETTLGQLKLPVSEYQPDEESFFDGTLFKYENFDICPKCMERLKEWVIDQMDVAKRNQFKLSNYLHSKPII